MCGKTLRESTRAALHRRFSSRQMFERSSGFPVRVTNTLPLVMPRASQ